MIEILEDVHAYLHAYYPEMVVLGLMWVAFVIAMHTAGWIR